MPPTENDPAFAIDGLRHWYLIGNAASAGHDTMTIYITVPSGTDFVDAYIPGMPPIRMLEQDGRFALQETITAVPAGEHQILFSRNGGDVAFAAATFNRSAPYYVLVSTDYDFSDCGGPAMGFMNALHRDHPGMRITHFWAPYTYTDPEVTPARRDEMDAWIKMQAEKYKDEIALHIHPWCNFVETAGVTCITDQSVAYPAGDLSGYTVKNSAYGRTDFGKLLQRAKELFNQRGLGTPKTYRAGAWTADLSVLMALADNGFAVDTSALNWKYIAEEWPGREILSWNMTHWSTITDTSQPYWPNQNDPQSPAGPNFGLLEVPDNGVMIDYVSVAEMNAIFDANWDRKSFAAPKTLMMGFHPSMGFSQAEYKRVDDFLKYADMALAAQDLGPVVYITLSDVAPAFPAL